MQAPAPPIGRPARGQDVCPRIHAAGTALPSVGAQPMDRDGVAHIEFASPAFSLGAHMERARKRIRLLAPFPFRLSVDYFSRPWIAFRPSRAQALSFSLGSAPETPMAPMISPLTMIGSPPALVV